MRVNCAANLTRTCDKADPAYLYCEQGTEGVESGRNPYDDFERPLKPKRRIESAADDDLDDEFLEQLM